MRTRWAFTLLFLSVVQFQSARAAQTCPAFVPDSTMSKLTPQDRTGWKDAEQRVITPASFSYAPGRAID